MGDAARGLGRQHAERAVGAAGVEERLLAMDGVGGDESVELVGDVADERQVGLGLDAGGLGEHGFEERGLQRHGEQRVEAVAPGLVRGRRRPSAPGDASRAKSTTWARAAARHPGSQPK